VRDDGAGERVRSPHRSAGRGQFYESQTLTFDIDRTSRGLRAVNIAVVASE
jgi:hypothetical protein